MQSLPNRQKLSSGKKYNCNRRTTPDFSGNFPDIDGCFAPQNTPREGSECPECCTRPRKTLSRKKHNKRDVKSRPTSVNEVMGGCGRLSVSPNMDFEKIPVGSTVYKRLPPIATIQDWRELSPELLKRDAAWNILCKHCPRIGANSRKEYFRRVVIWRNGIINENERRNCMNSQLQKITSEAFNYDQKTNQDVEKPDSFIGYPHHFYNEYAKSRKRREPKKEDHSNLHMSKRKEMQNRKPKHPAPAPVWQQQERTLEPITPSTSRLQERTPEPMTTATPQSDTIDEDYTNCKVARYLQMYVPKEKNIHRGCKPLDKIFEPACQSVLEPLRLVYNRKCLPGILQKKSKIKNEAPSIKNYAGYGCEVNNIGLRYYLPEANPNVGKRQISRKDKLIYTNKEKKKIDKKPTFPSIPRFIFPLNSNWA